VPAAKKGLGFEHRNSDSSNASAASVISDKRDSSSSTGSVAKKVIESTSSSIRMMRTAFGMEKPATKNPLSKGLNIFVSDMISEEFVRDRLEDVKKDRTIRDLEMEDMLTSDYFQTLLPGLKKILFMGDREWESVAFVDTIGTPDEFKQWQGVKQRLKDTLEEAFALDFSTLTQEVVSIKANIRVQQGYSLKTLVGILRSTKRLKSVYKVEFAGALFQCGPRSLAEALERNIDDKGRLLAEIEIRVECGWKENPDRFQLLEICLHKSKDITDKLMSAKRSLLRSITTESLAMQHGVGNGARSVKEPLQRCNALVEDAGSSRKDGVENEARSAKAPLRRVKSFLDDGHATNGSSRTDGVKDRARGAKVPLRRVKSFLEDDRAGSSRKDGVKNDAPRAKVQVRRSKSLQRRISLNEAGGTRVPLRRTKSFLEDGMATAASPRSVVDSSNSRRLGRVGSAPALSPQRSSRSARVRATPPRSADPSKGPIRRAVSPKRSSRGKARAISPNFSEVGKSPSNGRLRRNGSSHALSPEQTSRSSKASSSSPNSASESDNDKAQSNGRIRKVGSSPALGPQRSSRGMKSLRQNSTSDSSDTSGGQPSSSLRKTKSFDGLDLLQCDRGQISKSSRVSQLPRSRKELGDNITFSVPRSYRTFPNARSSGLLRGELRRNGSFSPNPNQRQVEQEEARGSMLLHKNDSLKSIGSLLGDTDVEECADELDVVPPPCIRGSEVLRRQDRQARTQLAKELSRNSLGKTSTFKPVCLRSYSTDTDLGKQRRLLLELYGREVSAQKKKSVATKEPAIADVPQEEKEKAEGTVLDSTSLPEDHNNDNGALPCGHPIDEDSDIDSVHTEEPLKSTQTADIESPPPKSIKLVQSIPREVVESPPPKASKLVKDVESSPPSPRRLALNGDHQSMEYFKVVKEKQEKQTAPQAA